MNIRKAILSDLATIIENNMKLAEESESISLDKSTVEQAVETMLRKPEKGFYLIAEEQNEIIGQLMITFEWSDWRNTTIWWIQSVYIQKAKRKQGVFKQLLKGLKKIAASEDIVLFRLYVHTSNTNAISVYKQLGMQEKSYKIFEIKSENILI